jgi:hypothetical protein
MLTNIQKIVIITFLLFSISISAANCEMIYIDIETMWNESDLAVLGKVTSINNTQKGGFYRIVEIKVESYYIKKLDAPIVRIRIEGGEFGDWGVWVEDQPEFRVGEHVFVFLRVPEEITGDYEYEVFGMYQGKWTVDGSTAIQSSRSFEIPSDEDLEDIAASRADSRIDDYRKYQQLLLMIAFGSVSVILLIVVYRRLK